MSPAPPADWQERAQAVLDRGRRFDRRIPSFLLRSQLPDGSWRVATRAEPIQAYFESGFPHGHDQWISQSGTAWAVMALYPLTVLVLYGVWHSGSLPLRWPS